MIFIATVYRKSGQSIDELINKFNEKCTNEGIKKDYMSHMSYNKASKKKVHKVNQQQK